MLSSQGLPAAGPRKAEPAAWAGNQQHEALKRHITNKAAGNRQEMSEVITDSRQLHQKRNDWAGCAAGEPVRLALTGPAGQLAAAILMHYEQTANLYVGWGEGVIRIDLPLEA